ncbi:hypothetical protein PAXRUDRAFT_783703 [Paxillus rubicundulus Ve08.2h10]|uniref:Secreted protein n=1 Tax=Paxillus rubicundulus Ve08.2h10 TaxID=930991 RepID=A0A0D0CXR4_9AGAM|nr:hypothetical protein PAXRUDRAFT_783703 [Paxillus rubicundulus Ve08.2h10]
MAVVLQAVVRFLCYARLLAIVNCNQTLMKGLGGGASPSASSKTRNGTEFHLGYGMNIEHRILETRMCQ